jgi:DNA helicase-2/ATP-dependent DNA helicase PcrA
MFSLRSSFIDAIPEELCLLSNKTASTSSYMPSFKSKNRIRKKSTLSPDAEFKVSDMVEHKLYGKGRITDVQGVGENSKITIKFRGNVVKKFIKKYANLKNIN